MFITNMKKNIWAVIFLWTAVEFYCVAPALVSSFDLMKCSYGERGSLTATCVNATTRYFKSTSYRFDQLDETLKCVNCTLTVIDSGTFDISGNQIRNLDLTGSKIESLKQKAFVGLIFLENLLLSHNNIRSIYPATFAGVKKIKFIDLSHNEINILSDDGFLELVNLENLNLKHNNIQTIAARAFNGLTQLTNLNLMTNQIAQLRDIFLNLTSLEVLNLEENSIYILNGEEFFNLTTLTELNVAHNKLSHPVINLRPNNSLKNIYLRSNFIDKIDSKFLIGAHKLERLDLSFNQISEIRQKIFENLYNLVYLNLSHNLLKRFQTGTFSALPHLEYLNCSYNSIDELQITGVFPIHSLHTLDISANHLVDIDYVGLISRLPRLSYLKLENNDLHCDLETDMAEYFAEDNFKYVFYDNTVGARKCVDGPVKHASVLLADEILEEKSVDRKGVSRIEITIIILICLIIICIGFLFFLQYRTYQQLLYHSPNRTTSSVNLISTDLEARRSDDYLRE